MYSRAAAFALLAFSALAAEVAPMRPPAVPLIVHDPYFSIWSMADELTAKNTSHWSGIDQPITGLLRIDDKVRRFIGGHPRWAAIDAMRQVSRQVTATSTVYGFESDGVHLDLTFLTPALPDDLDVLSRPVTYISFDLRSTDGRSHSTRLYWDSPSPGSGRGMWSRYDLHGMKVIRVGSLAQNVLDRSGDRIEIDWGHLYLAAPDQPGVKTLGVTAHDRSLFASTLDLPESHDLEIPDQTDRDIALAAISYDIEVSPSAPVSRLLLCAYDEIYSIEYFERRLRPYWRKKGVTIEDLLTKAAADFPSLREKCKRFDATLASNLIQAGGPKYAALAILAYRQTFAAHKLAIDYDGTPLYFPKENSSNGCIGTVDVIYPSAPFFLLFNPRLLEAQLRPVLDYAASGRWPWPYAPHDLGQYPLANGQVYGGGEKSEDRQMPVEESGNMLILMAALANRDGNAEFSRRYWPILTRWAEYLRDKGLDPAEQLSTDDFAGHLAHNTNLSIKAITALGAYGQLAEKLGKTDVAKTYREMAQSMAKKWVQMADDGDHYRLAFDKPGTWSQKYNLVWDKLLGLGLFPPEVAAKEIAFYEKHANTYGVPLDSRADYTKLDWLIWTATLATNPRDFETISEPAYRFANETPDRVPLSDWYWTSTGKQRGFQARSVVGGVFIKMLAGSMK
ncbi:MAG TPA: DUF4965 domain-containing protein [Bryobacteraceae bacterium]|jgi:hypothetical protein